MLERLEKMGLVDSKDGQLGAKQQIVLLHIYASRLNGEKPDVDGILTKINGGQLSSFTQLLSSETEQYFARGFNDGIEKLHALVAQKRADEGIENSFAAAKKYDEIEERMTHLCAAFRNKRERLDEIQNWLSDKQTLSEMKLGADGVQTLKEQFEQQSSDYETKRLQKLPLATRYILSSEVRLGKYEKDIEI